MPGTGKLIDQFCEAAERWARVNGDRSSNWIAADTLVLTGAGDRYPGIGAVDRADFTPAEQAKLTVGELRGTHTIDQMRDWLKKVTGPRGLDEEFLVLGLIGAFDRQFEELSEGYGAGIARNRARAEHLERVLADERLSAEWLDAMNRELDRTPAPIGSYLPREPTTKANLIEML